MFENLRAHIFGKYSKHDIELLKHIEDLYKEHVNSEEDAFLKSFIPEQLSAGDKSERKFKEDCLDTSHWENQIGNGALKTISSEVINYILNSQNERYQKLQSKAKQTFLFAKQLNDPISLLFQAIKTWLARKISFLNCADDNLCDDAKDSLDKHIDFLNDFLSQRSVKLFNEITHSNGDFHKVKKIIKDIISKLTSIRELIEVVQNDISSRDLFRSLGNAMEHTITAGIRYIYYVLQSHATVKAFEFQRIVTPQSKDEAILQTRNGKLLRKLLSTEIFTNLYIGSIIQPTLTIEASSSSQIALQNRTLTIPSVDLMLAEITVDPPKFNGITSRLNYPDMQKKHDVFIQKLIEFAYFKEVINVFLDAAGVGGDIAVYGGAVRILSVLFVQFNDLIEELCGIHSFIDDAAKNYYIEMLGEKDPPKVWLDNYDKSRSYSKEFSKKIGDCRKNAAKIKAAADSFKLSEATKKLLKLRDELNQRSVVFLTNRGIEYTKLDLGLTPPGTKAITNNEFNFQELMSRPDESIMHEVVFLELNEPDSIEKRMKLLDIILSRNPQHYEARERRIVLASDTKKYEKAIKDCDWLLDSSSSDIQNFYEPDVIVNFYYTRAVNYYNWGISLSDLNERRNKLNKSQEDLFIVISNDGDYEIEAKQLLEKINKQIGMMADFCPDPFRNSNINPS